MIQFNPTIEALLKDPVVESFAMVTIGTYKTTNYFRNISLDGVDNYVADGQLITTDPAQLTTVVDREVYKIVLADPTYIFGDDLDANLVGKTAQVRIGFVNQTTKQPYETTANTLLIYKGMIDSTGYDIETSDQGESRLVITCASPLANLDATRSLMTAKKSLSYIDGADTSFDQVYEGSGGIALRWGRV